MTEARLSKARFPTLRTALLAGCVAVLFLAAQHFKPLLQASINPNEALNAALEQAAAAWDGAPKLGLASAGRKAIEVGQGLQRIKPAAQVFASFVAAHREQLQAEWQQRLEAAQERGIVVAAGQPGTLANTFVGLHVLRHTVGCKLPVTIM